MSNQEIQELTEAHVMNTYARFPIALVRGEGVRVWDADGKAYLDFVAGIAVNSLGHCHHAVAKAVSEQVRSLIHVSNLYHIEPQALLARALCEHSFADRVFITALNSFHGRTLATLTATGQEKIRLGYDPLPAGFRYVPFNDLEAVEDAVDERTAAIWWSPSRARAAWWFRTSPTCVVCGGCATTRACC